MRPAKSHNVILQERKAIFEKAGDSSVPALVFFLANRGPELDQFLTLFPAPFPPVIHIFLQESNGIAVRSFLTGAGSAAWSALSNVVQIPVPALCAGVEESDLTQSSWG